MDPVRALSGFLQTARRPRRNRALTALTALTLAGAVLLSGCAQGPGTAAVVDGRVVSQQEVQRTTQDLAALLPNPLDGSAVLVALMVGPYFVDAAAENGVGVSDDQARALATQIAAGQEREVADVDLSRSTLDLLKFTLASERLAQLPNGAEVLRAVEDEVFAADIDVSPRYGDLSETGQLVRPTMPWLSTPSPV